MPRCAAKHNSCADHFVDIAVRNPDRPGEFLAGIECDGAGYHSSRSARDRDRIRQEILESLGWRGRIYRIWSTDWFYDPRRETKKLIEFLERRRAASKIEPVYEHEEEYFEEESEASSEEVLTAQGEREEVVVADAEDLFVEVGNRVTYCLVDNPTEKNTILIVDSESNPKLNLKNAPKVPFCTLFHSRDVKRSFANSEFLRQPQFLNFA